MMIFPFTIFPHPAELKQTNSNLSIFGWNDTENLTAVQCVLVINQFLQKGNWWLKFLISRKFLIVLVASKLSIQFAQITENTQQLLYSSQRMERGIWCHIWNGENFFIPDYVQWDMICNSAQSVMFMPWDFLPLGEV